MSLIDSATDGQLLPLQLDYQRFMQLGSRRLPQTLYMHERGYRSDTINTDALGLRYSHWGGQALLAGRTWQCSASQLAGGRLDRFWHRRER